MNDAERLWFERAIRTLRARKVGARYAYRDTLLKQYIAVTESDIRACYGYTPGALRQKLRDRGILLPVWWRPNRLRGWAVAGCPECSHDQRGLGDRCGAPIRASSQWSYGDPCGCLNPWHVRPTMDRVYDRIREMLPGARHIKKNKALRDLTYDEIIGHLRVEADELRDALAAGQLDDAKYELADVLCIALHVAVREGWSLLDLADAMQTKLDLRFEMEQPT